MTDQERQLVQTITEQVIAVLRERGANTRGEAASAAGPGAPVRVDIRPPIGICTGDYSKFPELAGRLYAVGSGAIGGAGSPRTYPSPQPPTPQGERGPEPIPLVGIVTANRLQAAMDGSPDGVAVLAPDARLSPLANDLARKFPNRIRRATSTPSTGGPNPDNAAALPWLWWIDGACPVVQEVTTQRRDRLRPASAPHTPSALTQVIRDLAAAIRSHQVAGGMLFVHNAARAMCLANRCGSIRAVVGTCGEAVEQGISELGANVLVVEYPHHGHRSASGMVERMLQQPPRVPPSVERELSDLHRCG